MPDNTPHIPTDKSRAEVGALVSFGVNQEDIARFIGICVDTLAKHYRHELDTALTRANAAVGEIEANRVSRIERRCGHFAPFQLIRAPQRKCQISASCPFSRTSAPPCVRPP